VAPVTNTRMSKISSSVGDKSVRWSYSGKVVILSGYNG
jgi:hypothetical protein